MRTADQIEEQNAQKDAIKAEQAGVSQSDEVLTPKTVKTAPKAFLEAAKATQFKKGCAPGPGRPKRDFAAEIARMAMEMCPEEVAEAMVKQLMKGNAYTFKELAERGYGKLKEISEVTHIHQDKSDGDINQRIAELVRECGLQSQIEEIGANGTAGREATTAVTAQDSDLLPR